MQVYAFHKNKKTKIKHFETPVAESAFTGLVSTGPSRTRLVRKPTTECLVPSLSMIIKRNQVQGNSIKSDDIRL